jgi:uncharacterized phiE125 gp8 family phage protein
MWYPAKVTAGPAEDPDLLAQAMQQAVVEHGEDEALLKRLIATAYEHVEKYCCVRFGTQTIIAKCDGFGDMRRLPIAPVQSVTSITYLDTDGTGQTVAATVYEERFDELETAIVPKHRQSWPAIQPGSRIELTVEAGYEVIPPTVRQAMLMFIADSYQNRAPVKIEGWTAFDNLLCNHRRGA